MHDTENRKKRKRSKFLLFFSPHAYFSNLASTYVRQRAAMLPVKLDNARKRSWIKGSYELKIKVGVGGGSPIRIVLVKMLYFIIFHEKTVKSPIFLLFLLSANKQELVSHINDTDFLKQY